MSRIAVQWLPPRPCMPSLALGPFPRHYSMQEPSALIAVARICAGGRALKPGSLPRPHTHFETAINFALNTRCSIGGLPFIASLKGDLSQLAQPLSSRFFGSRGSIVLNLLTLSLCIVNYVLA